MRIGLTVACSVLVLASSLFAGRESMAGEWTVEYNNPGGFLMTLNATDETHVFGFGTMPDPNDPQNSIPIGYKMTNGVFGMFEPPVLAAGNMFYPSRVQCPLPDRCYMLGMDINMGTMAMKSPFRVSTDGGDSWTMSPDPFFKRPMAPSDFASYGANTVVFFGSDTLAMISHDGGKTAKAWFVPTIGEKQYMSIKAGFVLNDNVAWLANGNVVMDEAGKVVIGIESIGAILKTSDLAKVNPREMVWEALIQDQPFYVKKMHFVDEMVGYMIAQIASGVDDPKTVEVLRKTVDGGRVWTDIALPKVGEMPAIEGIGDFFVFDADNLIVLAWAPDGSENSFGIIYEITDGATPVAVVPDPSEHKATMFAITCITRNLCYTGGSDAGVFKYVNTIPVEVEQDEDTGIVADSVDRDAVGEVSDSGNMMDVVTGTDLNNFKPSSSGGCSAAAPSGNAPSPLFAIVMLIVGCAVAFGVRRARS